MQQSIIDRVRSTQFTNERVRAQVLEALCPVIGIGFPETQKATLGRSKVGGKPHLPAGFEWPTDRSEPLAFVLQLNFAECKEFDVGGDLPAEGMLYVFCSVDETMLSDIEPPSVIRWVAKPSSLVETDFPGNLDAVEGRLDERPMAFSFSYVLGDPRGMAGRFDHRDERAVTELLESLGCFSAARMLGRPQFSRAELDDAFDPEKHELLLDASGTSIWRKGEHVSIFEDRSLYVCIGKRALAAGKLENALLLVEGADARKARPRRRK